MDKLSTIFSQREIAKINMFMNGTFKYDFPPKKSNYYLYLFDSIHRKYFDTCIKYFRDPNTKLNNHQYLIGLAGLCKAIITVPKIWKYYYSKLDDSHILHLPEYVKKFTEQNYHFFRVEIGHEFKKESPIDIEFRKLSLFAFEIYYFSSFIHTIKKNCPEGIFHQFTFEESVFFLYLYPFNQEFIFSKKKYHKNIDFYINCIAAATKAFMEGLGYKHDRKSYTTNDNSSLSELIFLDFLDFYETNLKTNENTCEYYL